MRNVNILFLLFTQFPKKKKKESVVVEESQRLEVIALFFLCVCVLVLVFTPVRAIEKKKHLF